MYNKFLKFAPLCLFLMAGCSSNNATPQSTPSPNDDLSQAKAAVTSLQTEHEPDGFSFLCWEDSNETPVYVIATHYKTNYGKDVVHDFLVRRFEKTGLTGAFYWVAEPVNDENKGMIAMISRFAGKGNSGSDNRDDDNQSEGWGDD